MPTFWAPHCPLASGCSVDSALGVMGPGSLVVGLCSMPGIGLGCWPWEWLSLVVVIPPPTRSVAWLAVRLERFASRRASCPSVCFLEMVAGDAGRLNDRGSDLGLADEPEPEGRVAARQRS